MGFPCWVKPFTTCVPEQLTWVTEVLTQLLEG